MSFIVGLDVGTATGAAATKRDGCIQRCELGELSPTMPSVVVLHDDGSALTGEAAERVAGLELVRVARDLRRDPMLQADPIVIGGQVSTPYAMLRALYTGTVERVCNLHGEAPTHVVVTHPALPEGLRCDMVERIADELFPGAMLVPEPVAATVKLACDSILPADGNIVVYDLGGGNLDLTLVRREGDSFSIIGEPSGLTDLGGVDVDDMVLGHVDATLDGAIAQLDPTDPIALEAMARLQVECRAAKHRLSYEDEVTIDSSLPDSPALVTMHRHELEELLFPRLEESMDVLEEMVSEAGLRMGEVDAVIAVGGSSRIPLVPELIRARTSLPVITDPEPELTVAFGAVQMVDEGASSASVFPIAGTAVPSPVGVGAAVSGGDTPLASNSTPTDSSGDPAGQVVASQLVGGGAYADDEYDGPTVRRSPDSEADERDGSQGAPAPETDGYEAAADEDEDQYTSLFEQGSFKPKVGAAVLGGVVVAALVGFGTLMMRDGGSSPQTTEAGPRPPEGQNMVFPDQQQVSETVDPDEARPDEPRRRRNGDRSDRPNGESENSSDPSVPATAAPGTLPPGTDPTTTADGTTTTNEAATTTRPRPSTTTRPPTTPAPTTTTSSTTSTTTSTTTSSTTSSTTTSTTEAP